MDSDKKLSSKKPPKKNSSKKPSTRKTIRRSSVRKTTQKSPTKTTAAMIDYTSLSAALTTPEYDDVEQAHRSTDHEEHFDHPTPFTKTNKKWATEHAPLRTFDSSHTLLPTNGPPTSRPRGLLIACVAGFFLLIISFWIWNIKMSFSTSTLAAGPDRDLMAQTKASWQKAFNDKEDTNLSPLEIEKLNEALTHLTTSSTISTTISSTTILIPPSTSSSTTSTSATPTSTPKIPVIQSTSTPTSSPKNNPSVLPISRPKRK